MQDILPLQHMLQHKIKPRQLGKRIEKYTYMIGEQRVVRYLSNCNLPEKGNRWSQDACKITDYYQIEIGDNLVSHKSIYHD
jgi:hypothetical protein